MLVAACRARSTRPANSASRLRSNPGWCRYRPWTQPGQPPRRQPSPRNSGWCRRSAITAGCWCRRRWCRVSSFHRPNCHLGHCRGRRHCPCRQACRHPGRRGRADRSAVREPPAARRWRRNGARPGLSSGSLHGASQWLPRRSVSWRGTGSHSGPGRSRRRRWEAVLPSGPRQSEGPHEPPEASPEQPRRPVSSSFHDSCDRRARPESGVTIRTKRRNSGLVAAAERSLGVTAAGVTSAEHPAAHYGAGGICQAGPSKCWISSR